MPKRLCVRALTDDEQVSIRRLAHARSVPAGMATCPDRLARPSGKEIAMIATAVGVCRATVRTWVKRFNADGIVGLQDAPRSGGPISYPPEAVGEIIALSLTDPQTLGLPFGAWTLDRLVAYLHKERGIGMRRSRLSEVLVADGGNMVQ